MLRGWMLAGMVGALAIGLSGCMYAPKTKNDLRERGIDRQEDYPGNYQSLAACWESHAEPALIDFKKASAVTVFSDLGVAEVNTGFSLFEFRQKAESTTTVTSYDGGIHKRHHTDWFKVVAACSSGSLK